MWTQLIMDRVKTIKEGKVRTTEEKNTWWSGEYKSCILGCLFCNLNIRQEKLYWHNLTNPKFWPNLRQKKKKKNMTKKGRITMYKSSSHSNTENHDLSGKIAIMIINLVNSVILEISLNMRVCTTHLSCTGNETTPPPPQKKK